MSYTQYSPDPEAEWEAEVMLSVQVTLRVKPGEGFTGWGDRTPDRLAIAAILCGQSDPARIDGFADLAGSVDIGGAWPENGPQPGPGSEGDAILHSREDVLARLAEHGLAPGKGSRP